MQTKPQIELRNIKHTAWASQETHCYQASLYVDGKLWGTVSNEGHGGPDDFAPAKGFSYSDLISLNKRIKATMPSIEFEGGSFAPDLELICGDLVNEWLRTREFNKAMRSKVLFTKPGSAGVWQVAVKKPMALWMVLDSLKAKHPDYTYLADLPIDQAKAIYFAA